MVQRQVNAWGYKIAEDSCYGPATEQAVKRYRPVGRSLLTVLSARSPTSCWPAHRSASQHLSMPAQATLSYSRVRQGPMWSCCSNV